MVWKYQKEPDFLFSYNITSKNKKIKEALNRERLNISRNCYSSRIKDILKLSNNDYILDKLGHELSRYSEGDSCDEIKWIDVQEYVVKNLNVTGRYIFLSNYDILNHNSAIDEIKRSGETMIIIPENLKNKLGNILDVDGGNINTLEEYINEDIANFKYKFIEIDQMTKIEKDIFEKTDEIINLVGNSKNIREIKISETMQKDILNFQEVLGIWLDKEGFIIIKRSQLKSISEYGSTLLHELTHAKYGNHDITREFELDLTKIIGKLLEHVF